MIQGEHLGEFPTYINSVIDHQYCQINAIIYNALSALLNISPG